MPPAMPAVEGVEHSHHDLPTGVRVHLAAAGPPDAPAVLCLHGWPQHWWEWRDVIAELRGELRVLAPDLRGLGWSGQPADGDFTKQRLADDAIALLDALGLERVRLVGHDWGAWAAILAALTAPERFSGLLVMSAGSPWVPRRVAFRNGHKLAYQIPLAMPWAGERLVRGGAYPGKMLAIERRDRRWRPEEIEAYLGPLREPAIARASSLLYRHFLTRELPAAAAGRFGSRRPAMPARMLHGSREALGTYLVRGFPGEVEIVDGAGHFLPEEAPALVAERIRNLPGG